ncbi:hypothetical protein BAE44_0000913 [Dichanthelium oligosanthes]|uniref:Uncharacterized protein n=1 Tax=Dichanthelium oligosanthes TaxID=888268 RepID=A0A1E5WL39_9POAL|nr:hypothetical protein BAE44_0000913 [Dichanthelium oligosanthes]
MEIIFSAFLGEFAHRSIAFIIKKLSEEAASLPSDEHLRRKLLRVRIIVEEAEGRQIRNQAMLEQLKVLRAGMYRGHYVLDSFRYQAYQDDDKDDDHGAVSHSFALSKFNPAKRIQLCGERRSKGGEKELNQVLRYLEVIISDVSEFVMLLNGCPPLYRRPYNTYMVLEKCMFGRHDEIEHIIDFLMQKGLPGTEDLGVLPIVGPAKAGKSTLIEHVCNDERVRTAFSQVVFLTEADLDERLTNIRDCGTIKHQKQASYQDERVLVIVKVNGDIHEDILSSLYSAAKGCATNGRRIILSQEAYWYFFKALAFGSVNPEEEPKLASIAIEIAMGLSGSFISGNIVANMLRANFNAKFWSMALACAKEVSQRYCFIFGAHPISPLQNRKIVRRLNGSNDYCLVFNDYQVVSAQNEAPLITFQEVLLGIVEPHGKFDVVAWKSPIPPHYTYIFSCEIQKAPKLDVQKHISKHHN